ncbi:ATP-binding cassette domain-containing protein [Fodinicola feengrottensis]|uniref:ATP-binding cassette domain-containing protein n=1 Tax=Fodinicola feengrottensis TaxID=435914 RepID=A0ABN2HHQ5_9ACTN
MTPGIELDQATVTYQRNTVLDGFSLTVDAGELVAVLGPSGSGKTTALRAVAGFVPLASGTVRLSGRDVTGMPPHRRDLGLVVQSYALFPHMSVAENVAFGPKSRGVRKVDIAERVRESLAMVGMASFADRAPRQLSGGQQQRVAIARALAVKPKVLLLDEPLSALDAALRSEMTAEIDRLHRALPAVSILYVTHDQTEALTLADRIAVLAAGKLVDVGTAQDLYLRPPSAFTASFLGAANVLPVQVLGAERTNVLRIQLGEHILTAAGPADHRPGAAQLAIRPHRLRIETDHSDGTNRLPGRISAVQWRGSSFRTTVALDGGGEVVVESPATGSAPTAGERAVLVFDPTDGVVVPAELVAS